MGETGSSWTTKEEVQLCESWATVTVCPITGNQQTLTRLWQKVHEHYVENWMGATPVRPPGALQSHFKPLKRLLKVWHNAKNQVGHHRPNGTNQLDEEHQINLEYLRVMKKQFEHKECWEAVKEHPYFRDALQPPVTPFVYSTANGPQTESPINLDDEEIVLETPPNSVGRPMGQKAAKEARRKGKKKEDVGESMVQALLAMNESTKISNEILRKREEDRHAESARMMAFEEAKEDARIMAMRNSDISFGSQDWFKKLKREIRRKTDPNANADCYRPLFEEPQSPQ
ncbi:PREDICTED: uncharacterized protein LOC101312677 [Fragaria vesca subsp. vesca]|uniref:uncharacterized protein LOC101312677 n=1 Tax=Fragaria vesca subsp. vesca TaxID=101020 RepID=UPI0002C35895|nr:PREDICTED: uncharacterized protein LOC101312677 [Fragaria vesca subsp. vesca]